MFATVREREKLLRWLDAPVGALTVGRRKGEDEMDVMIVRMRGGYSVPDSKRMPRFDEFPVEYLTES